MIQFSAHMLCQAGFINVRHRSFIARLRENSAAENEDVTEGHKIENERSLDLLRNYSAVIGKS
jgi:hypothetical protein